MVYWIYCIISDAACYNVSGLYARISYKNDLQSPDYSIVKFLFAIYANKFGKFILFVFPDK